MCRASALKGGEGILSAKSVLQARGIRVLAPEGKARRTLMSHQEPEAFSTTMISWNDNASGLPVQAP